MEGNLMRRKKTKEQLISIIVLSSVFVFFIFLKTNPEISATSLSSETLEAQDLENGKIVEVKTDEEYIQDDESIPNAQELEIPESIIEYTESELNRAKAYLNRNWKPDHTINLAAWEYVSSISIMKDKETLKEVFDIDKNQVVNAIK